MLHGLKPGLVLLLFCVVGCGCDRRPDAAPDEQKNAHYQAGKDRLSALDYKGAIVSFERALEANPKSALAHYELGVLYDQHESDYAAALYHYQKALKLRPSGYPAENIRQRIPACRQELVKEDSLAVINPSVLRETERLREDNQGLRKQIELLQAQLGNRPLTVRASGFSPTSLSGSPSSAGTAGSTNAAGSRTASSLTDRSRPGSAPGRTRTHSVKAGETAAAIARQYQVKLPTLLAANPGLEPRRLRVGQVINVPAPVPGP